MRTFLSIALSAIISALIVTAGFQQQKINAFESGKYVAAHSGIMPADIQADLR